MCINHEALKGGLHPSSFYIWKFSVASIWQLWIVFRTPTEVLLVCLQSKCSSNVSWALILVELFPSQLLMQYYIVLLFLS